MDTPTNLFRQRLSSSETLIGLWLALADPYSAELCAGSGFDWLLVDGEHAPFDLRTTLATLQSVAPYPSHPVVRLPEGSSTLIKQALDIGATTLLIPMVESAAQAQMLVRATRYPPTGIRGVGSGIARSSRWSRFPSYLHEANDRICLLVQIETLTALEQLDEICAVAGVDGVFIGPADLSASMGYFGQAAHPNVVARIEAALTAIRKHGKAPGILCADPDLARRYIAAGAQFVAVGVDTSLLATATRRLAGAFGPSQGKNVEPIRAGY
ncbi:4-hydroxy-2-oxoheptanedioate aldolase [Paraburkholderia hospita]|uniref:4-hydroxy-2-oxoheptanedioate aldolase n=1 Tax=Paraburkholderia hospita TaxID=169430 RepID=UPI000DEF02D5|nr:4-hydroxy-2-oxoheptanedioate aldolase [Paraburkholderia hospita]AXF06387.1 4-hydroxy-2-oxoheptanedioate aldolase [Paraburkholderia hospita]